MHTDAVRWDSKAPATSRLKMSCWNDLMTTAQHTKLRSVCTYLIEIVMCQNNCLRWILFGQNHSPRMRTDYINSGDSRRHSPVNIDASLNDLTIDTMANVTWPVNHCNFAVITFWQFCAKYWRALYGECVSWHIAERPPADGRVAGKMHAQIAHLTDVRLIECDEE